MASIPRKWFRARANQQTKQVLWVCGPCHEVPVDPSWAKHHHGNATAVGLAQVVLREELGEGVRLQAANLLGHFGKGSLQQSAGLQQCSKREVVEARQEVKTRSMQPSASGSVPETNRSKRSDSQKCCKAASYTPAKSYPRRQPRQP